MDVPRPRPGIAAAAPYRDVPVLVVGASGFIGRRVARLLSDAGSALSLVVRDRVAAKAILDPLGVRGELLEADVSDQGGLNALVRRVRPAITFNLAGYGVDLGEDDADTARRINTLAVGGLADAVADALAGGNEDSWPGSRLVHAGTGAEYGPVAGDLHEDLVESPTTVYGRTKRDGTRLLAGRCAASGLRGVTARLFTVYGPGELPHRLLPSLLRTARDRTPLALTSGAQRRDFTYVDDVAEGLLRLGLADAPPGAIVNLATSRTTNVRSFVEAAARLLGLPDGLLRFGALPARPDELRQGDVRLERLRALLAWSPATSVDEGILGTMSHETGRAEAETRR